MNHIIHNIILFIIVRMDDWVSSADKGHSLSLVGQCVVADRAQHRLFELQCLALKVVVVVQVQRRAHAVGPQRHVLVGVGVEADRRRLAGRRSGREERVDQQVHFVVRQLAVAVGRAQVQRHRRVVLVRLLLLNRQIKCCHVKGLL